jgi:acylphosphatase
METRAEIIADGLVQGVGFRYFVARYAEKFRLSGHVVNQPDGSVKIVVEGDRSSVEMLIAEVKVGPRSAQVRDLRISWASPTNEFDRFQIR